MQRKMMTYYCSVLMLFAGISVYAKKVPLPPQDKPPSGPGLPIDGGLSYLLLAGAGYGIYAFRKRIKD